MLDYIYTTVLNYNGFIFKFIIELVLTYYILRFINNYKSYKKKVMLSIEGNIGVGKSSMLNILKKNLKNADFIDEPVDEWLTIVDENGKDILQTFYDDKKRWAYTFQNIAYITRMNHIIDKIMNSRNQYIILDRSLQADLNTFAKMLHSSGDLNDIEWSCYNKWNNFFERFYGQSVNHKIVYLRCEPEIALERLKIRNRSAETTIPLEYLESLHKYHDLWLHNNDKVLVFNANNDFVNNPDLAKEMMDKINLFIGK